MSTVSQDGDAIVRKCLDELRKDVDDGCLSQSRREEVLGQLKVLGRDVNHVKSRYDAEALNVLGHYGFGRYPRSTCREALRCIANALLLIPQCQNYFAELGFLPKAAEDLKLQEDEDEFLLSRILFLMTYNKPTDFEKVADKYDIPGSIMQNVNRHARTADQLAMNTIATAALSDSLKLLFNVIHAFPKYSSVFRPIVPDILKVISATPIPKPPLQPPLVWKLNALASVDLAKRDGLEGDQEVSEMLAVLPRLVEILDSSLRGYRPTQLDTSLIPLITILRSMIATGDDSLKVQLKEDLLPKDSERDLPLGQTSTLASRLLRLTTQPGLVNLPEAVSALLFELSDKDASAFVKNVGYGYAAGYLMTHKIPIPEDIQRPSSSRGDVPFNPITGQRLDREPVVDMPEMSQEEKEREAERLFVLFERLRATGVVDVQNPVHQAQQQGRFEEVDD